MTRARLCAFAFGNFAYAVNAMFIVGLLDGIARDLHVTAERVGDLHAAFFVTLCLAGPLISDRTAGIDRRALLSGSLAMFGLMSASGALLADYWWLLASRIAAALTIAAFAPQLAVTAAIMAGEAGRGRVMTLAYLGFALNMAVGLPMVSWLGGHFGWRSALEIIGLLPPIAAVLLWLGVPSGLRSKALDRSGWKSVMTAPAVICLLALTAAHAAGQYGFLTYLTLVARAAFRVTPEALAMLFMTFGIATLVGNVLGARMIARFGAARTTPFALLPVLAGLLYWLLAFSHPAAVAYGATFVFGLGLLTTMTSVQDRLYSYAPTLAPVSIATNHSALYLGMAVGAAAGGFTADSAGVRWIPAECAVFIIAALALSLAARRAEITFARGRAGAR